MSLTIAEKIECPYCMAFNDIEIDPEHDIGQNQIVDCQICCQPIELSIQPWEDGFVVSCKREDD